jgi:hypothetical protein
MPIRNDPAEEVLRLRAAIEEIIAWFDTAADGLRNLAPLDSDDSILVIPADGMRDLVEWADAVLEGKRDPTAWEERSPAANQNAVAAAVTP